MGRFARNKHSSLFGPFVSYDENEGLQIWYGKGPYSQHELMNVPHKLEFYKTLRWKGFPG
jgi:hypothetical protein